MDFLFPKFIQMKNIYLLILISIMGIGTSRAQELVSGKAVLTRESSGVYSIKVAGQNKQIDIRPAKQEHVKGILSVLFKDCENLRQSVFDLTTIDESTLVSTLEAYNKCTYSPYSPTDKEIEKADRFLSDQLKFFVTLGTSLNQIRFVDGGSSDTQVQGNAGIGLAGSPGFLGSLQNNLYFTLDAGMAFSDEKDFSNAPQPTELRTNSFLSSLGTEYHFNKNGGFQPLIGIGLGLRQDYYKGSYNSHNIHVHAGSAYIIPKMGILFNMNNNNSLGVLVGLIPRFKNELYFKNDEGKLESLSIDTYQINADIYFYF